MAQSSNSFVSDAGFEDHIGHKQPSSRETPPHALRYGHAGVQPVLAPIHVFSNDHMQHLSPPSSPNLVTVPNKDANAPLPSDGSPEQPHMIRPSTNFVPGFILRTDSSESASMLSSTAPPRSQSGSISDMLGRLRNPTFSKEFWLKDEACHNCFLCGAQFTAFRRKHHCRMCGRIFDSKCTSLVVGEWNGRQSSLRVCKDCKTIIDEYEDSEDEIARSPQSTPVPSLYEPDHELSNSETSALYSMPQSMRPKLLPLMAVPAVYRSQEKHKNHTSVEFPSIRI